MYGCKCAQHNHTLTREHLTNEHNCLADPLSALRRYRDIGWRRSIKRELWKFYTEVAAMTDAAARARRNADEEPRNRL